MANKRRSPKTPSIASALRAVWLDAAIPVTPDEVAAYDARHQHDPLPAAQPPREPTPFFSWERKESPATADNVVAFRTEAIPSSLALAARAENGVSPETRTKLARLIEEMKRETKEVE